jgi:Domain of unknown function (DUF5666)
MTTLWSPRTLHWSRGAAAALAVLSLLASALPGCGGGVGGEGTGAAVTLASGPITEFGSIVVNGVHYDVASASVDDLGSGGRTNANLQLGMVVEVAAGAIDRRSGTPRAVASQVRVTPELLGPADSVNAAAGTLVVLGQTVRVTAATNLNGLPGGLAGLQPNTGAVEVFGYLDVAKGQYVATRVQARASVAKYIVRGTVTGLNSATQTFSINGQTFNFSGASGGSAIGDDKVVRLELEARRGDDGRWQVSSSEGGTPSRSDADEAELKGLISAFNPATPGRFSVNGVPVNASTIVSALPAGLALGVRVEVEGALREGTLVAREVTVEDDDD